MDNNLSILQYREILLCMKSVYNIDLSNYSLTSLRRNIQNIIQNSRYKRTDKFLENLPNDKSLMHLILFNLYNESETVFRDPAMWRVLQHQIIPAITEKENLKIWLPEGAPEELFSLSIVLYELNVLNQSHIVVSGQSIEYLEKMRRNGFEIQDFENAEANYIRYNSHGDFKKYFDQSEKKFFLKKELLLKVHYQTADIFSIKLPYKPNLVLFRNRFLFFNHALEQKVINRFYDLMPGGGVLVCGIKENLEIFLVQDKFRIVDVEESIYKRLF